MSDEKNGTKFISETDNLDVFLQVKGVDPTTQQIQVEASIAKFQPPTETGQAPAILKKVTVSAIGADLDEANANALNKATELMGLGFGEDNV